MFLIFAPALAERQETELVDFEEERKVEEERRENDLQSGVSVNFGSCLYSGGSGNGNDFTVNRPVVQQEVMDSPIISSFVFHYSIEPAFKHFAQTLSQIQVAPRYKVFCSFLL